MKTGSIFSMLIILTLAGCGKERKEVMEEKTGIITFKGSPLTLLGPELKVGQMIPEATLTATDLSEIPISSFKGKTLIISTVPSLDTSVCSLQTKRFNEEAKKLGGQVNILTISMDLPFAQKRWCGAEGAEDIKVASDYKDAKFARASGLLIKELHLLARSVIIVDKTGKIAYIQIVPEVTTEPDYDAVLAALNELK